jgi:hypothetical protein
MWRSGKGPASSCRIVGQSGIAAPSTHAREAIAAERTRRKLMRNRSHVLRRAAFTRLPSVARRRGPVRRGLSPRAGPAGHRPVAHAARLGRASGPVRRRAAATAVPRRRRRPSSGSLAETWSCRTVRRIPDGFTTGYTIHSFLRTCSLISHIFFYRSMSILVLHCTDVSRHFLILLLSLIQFLVSKQVEHNMQFQFLMTPSRLICGECAVY